MSVFNRILGILPSVENIRGFTRLLSGVADQLDIKMENAKFMEIRGRQIMRALAGKTDDLMDIIGEVKRSDPDLFKLADNLELSVEQAANMVLRPTGGGLASSHPEKVQRLMNRLTEEAKGLALASGREHPVAIEEALQGIERGLGGLPDSLRAASIRKAMAPKGISSEELWQMYALPTKLMMIKGVTDVIGFTPGNFGLDIWD